MSRAERFAAVLVGLLFLVGVLGTLLVPPKPYLELLVLAPAAGASFLVAYWVAYRR